MSLTLLKERGRCHLQGVLTPRYLGMNPFSAPGLIGGRVEIGRTRFQTAASLERGGVERCHAAECEQYLECRRRSQRRDSVSSREGSFEVRPILIRSSSMKHIRGSEPFSARRAVASAHKDHVPLTLIDTARLAWPRGHPALPDVPQEVLPNGAIFW